MVDGGGEEVGPQSREALNQTGDTLWELAGPDSTIPFASDTESTSDQMPTLHDEAAFTEFTRQVLSQGFDVTIGIITPLEPYEKYSLRVACQAIDKYGKPVVGLEYEDQPILPFANEREGSAFTTEQSPELQALYDRGLRGKALLEAISQIPQHLQVMQTLNAAHQQASQAIRIAAGMTVRLEDQTGTREERLLYLNQHGSNPLQCAVGVYQGKIGEATRVNSPKTPGLVKAKAQVFRDQASHLPPGAQAGPKSA